MKPDTMSREKPPVPLYGFFLNGAYFLVFSIIFGIATVGTLFIFPETVIARFAGGGLLALIALFQLLAFLQIFLLPVRSAAFYDDHFTVVVKGKELRTFANSEIEAISFEMLPFKKWFPFPSLQKQLLVHVRGTAEPVVIPTNAKSKRMPNDLYSWLTELPRTIQASKMKSQS
jgi:hypothetical protein